MTNNNSWKVSTHDDFSGIRNDVTVKKEAFYADDYFLLNYRGEIVGIECGKNRVMLGDRVEIEGDTRGYIAPGITKCGYGEVVDFVDDYTDHYFGVRMDNGEYAHIKWARIAKVLPREEVA